MATMYGCRLRSRRKRTTAVFSGIEFGPNTYFIQGACRCPTNGTAWHMFLILLRDAFERSPHGKFIMGANNEAAGPTRFQQECRTSAYLTSIVEFTYRNTAESRPASHSAR